MMFKANDANNKSLYIYVLDDIKCNGTETHTAKIGEKITYACSFKYQGILSDDYVSWHDDRGNVLMHDEHDTYKSPVPTAQADTCYTGESTVRKLHNCVTGRPCIGLF